jgi:hypothetical protein
LPKPASMTLPRATTGAPAIATKPLCTARVYPKQVPEPVQNAPLLFSPDFCSNTATSSAAPPLSTHFSNAADPRSLHSDCSGLPPPATSATGLGHYGLCDSHPVDLSRLQAVYTAHRATFWTAVAADYGEGANPLVLEQAWKGNNPSTGATVQTPITPFASPGDHVYSQTMQGQGQDKTRISAILSMTRPGSLPSLAWTQTRAA